MKLLRVISLAAALLPALACAQWQWIDKDGHKVYSDRSPPADIPARKILRQPGGKAPPVPAEAEAAADVAAPAADTAAKATAQAAKTAANVPKISGKDKALEEKKKQSEEAAEARKKAEDDKIAQTKAENCERAKAGKTMMESGVRVSLTNAKGEREVLEDTGRAAQAKQLQQQIDANCK